MTIFAFVILRVYFEYNHISCQVDKLFTQNPFSSRTRETEKKGIFSAIINCTVFLMPLRVYFYFRCLPYIYLAY